MRRLLCIFISCFCLVFPLLAQSNRLIKELESKRGALQKQITESETLLKTTKKTVSSQLNGLAALTGQIEERKRYILTINKDVEAIDRELSSLERQLGQLQRDLKDKKRKYDSSVQYLYKNRSIEEKLMFIFSAQSLAQTYRRLRYVREYATYQRLQGEEILKKQEQVNKKKAEILQMLMLEPKLAILDETDSGLDVDAVRTVSRGVQLYRERVHGSLLIITHSTRILEALTVDAAHIMEQGVIVKNGDASLVDTINENGFGGIRAD